MSGFGELSVRRREREERSSSGLHFKRYMLLVVTSTQVHVFDARSVMTRWKAGDRLATWDRSAVRAWTDTKSVTTRLTLEIPSQNRRLELEAPKARRSTAGEVARVLASSSAPAYPTAQTPSPFVRVQPEETEHSREQHNQAGSLATTGGFVRLLAYSLPWIAVTSPSSGRSVNVSGYRLLAPIFSIGFSIVIIVAAAFYLIGRRDGSPRLLLSLGVGSVIAFLFQYSTTISEMGRLRTALQAQGLTVRPSVGFGVWIELAGVIMTLAGGLYANYLWKRTRPPSGSYVPHRPDVTVAEPSERPPV